MGYISLSYFLSGVIAGFIGYLIILPFIPTITTNIPLQLVFLPAIVFGVITGLLVLIAKKIIEKLIGI